MAGHYPAGTDADYYGHGHQPTSWRCACGRWFLTPAGLDQHLDLEALA